MGRRLGSPYTVNGTAEMCDVAQVGSPMRMGRGLAQGGPGCAEPVVRKGRGFTIMEGLT